MDSVFDFFVKEIENENPVVKVNAVNRLPIIIYSYSNPDTKKQDYLNYLENFLNKCDLDEVIFGLARALGDLAEYFKMDMMRLLDKLLVNEETVIREAAIESYVKMLKYVSQDDLSNVLVPEILKLKSQKKFPPKISALNLMSEIFPICNQKDQ